MNENQAVTMYILQVGRGGVPSAVLASPFRPTGQERSPKTAPQHVPTVIANVERRKFLKIFPC
jgi:hypothetical protein